MDASQYVDELINEYLLFRGFIKTFTNFNAEREARSSNNAAAERQRGVGGTGASAAGSNAPPSISSTSLALNLPTNVDALVDLLMGHVRACELDSLVEVTPDAAQRETRAQAAHLTRSIDLSLTLTLCALMLL